MTRKGFTLIEVVIAIVLIGVMTAFMFPRIGEALRRQDVRSARNAITTMNAQAKATAIQRGRLVATVLRSNRMVLVSRHPVFGTVDTIADQNLGQRYGVSITTDQDSLEFDARGIGMAGTQTRITVSKAGIADTIVITPVGSILR